ncbi:MAG: DUF2905 domain-containing protein [Candidatus Latescibacteria bacterium]|nr:DUF2905 domain-containing protein [Candidatus Latescibacterota bacterium]
MDPRFDTGRMLIIAGIILAAAGLLVMFSGRLPFIGRLPGDITIRGKGWSFHFPIVTGLIISLILTLVLNIFFRR